MNYDEKNFEKAREGAHSTAEDGRYFQFRFRFFVFWTGFGVRVPPGPGGQGVSQRQDFDANIIYQIVFTTVVYVIVE
jgi:hypothetical protein